MTEQVPAGTLTGINLHKPCLPEITFSRAIHTD